MSVIAMKCIDVKEHPNADALKIYQFDTPEYKTRTIVANLQNIYEIGDIVYVALDGTVLKDGLEIKTRKVRGEESQGMAMWKCQNNEVVGQDCSAQFCNVENK